MGQLELSLLVFGASHFQPRLSSLFVFEMAAFYFVYKREQFRCVNRDGKFTYAWKPLEVATICFLF